MQADLAFNYFGLSEFTWPLKESLPMKSPVLTNQTVERISRFEN
jgi:hypothetical protein